MESKEIFKLLLRFFSEDISDKELNNLKSWLAQNSENSRTFDMVNELLQLNLNPGNFDTEESWKEISSRLKIRTKKENRRFLFLRRKNLRLLFAASFFIVFRII